MIEKNKLENNQEIYLVYNVNIDGFDISKYKKVKFKNIDKYNENHIIIENDGDLTCIYNLKNLYTSFEEVKSILNKNLMKEKDKYLNEYTNQINLISYNMITIKKLKENIEELNIENDKISKEKEICIKKIDKLSEYYIV